MSTSTELSPTMIQALSAYADIEKSEHVNISHLYTVTLRTRGALVGRNLLAYGVGRPGYELTDLGRIAAAERFPAYAEWLERVQVRTSRCSNRWHASAPAYGRMLCPECPSDQLTIVDTAIKHMRELNDPSTSRSRFRWLVDQLTAMAQEVTEEQREECNSRAKAIQVSS